jgi:hypothetical protein
MPGHISGRPSSVVGVVGFLKGFLWLMGDVGSWEYLRHVGMYPCLLYIYICIYNIIYIIHIYIYNILHIHVIC